MIESYFLPVYSYVTVVTGFSKASLVAVILAMTGIAI